MCIQLCFLGPTKLLGMATVELDEGADLLEGRLVLVPSEQALVGVIVLGNEVFFQCFNYLG